MVSDKELRAVEQIVSGVVTDESLAEGNVLINCLHEIQNHFHNFVPLEAAEKVAEMLKVPESSVYEVLTFYTMFSVEKRGKYVIRVCNSLPCHVTGGKEIVETLKKELGCDFSQTSKDGLFTLEKTGCLGLCGVSPVIMINEEFYGNLTRNKVLDIINKIREEERG
ncbi:MAG: NAD(P)H-dependent oxidoreductase subunit E [Thermotogota bacterium]|nr:NAD(P)H-dependent oxidoreductase subunit E [Thermotogota bacterium]